MVWFGLHWPANRAGRFKAFFSNKLNRSFSECPSLSRSTVEEGGETVFPNADRKVTGEEWSECAKRGLAVKPFKGDAVMFYSLRPDGTTDTSSMHGSCPTTKGSKWSATKWIHVEPFMPAKIEFKKTGCDNVHEQCDEWAYFGECEKNPG